ncbi:MAG: NfeD family protein [Candidatus Hydrogenedentes bacterium]|nr:NfeD family protein [Candidatus Hydrogenedentota bacterium]
MNSTDCESGENITDIQQSPPTYPPRILSNLMLLALLHALGLLALGLLAILQKLGLPVESAAKVFGLMFVWVFFQIMNVTCVHGVSTRWLHAPVLAGLLLVNILICLLPAMLLADGFDGTAPPNAFSESLFLALLTTLFFLSHGLATFFFVAPEHFESFIRHVPVLGPFLENTLWLSSSANTEDDGASTVLHNNTEFTDETAAGLIGQEGVTRSSLRPHGKVRFADGSYEVRSEGQFIEEGTRVRVAGIDGPDIVVVPVLEEA